MIEVRNNYNECITNLACSIRKYFDLEYKHNTLLYIDDILNNVKPKNVVTILYDGMGSNIMDRVLSSDAFLIKNRKKSITTVFPATTVAATTSITTGLNPVETGMLGWYMYYKDIDKTIVTFLNSQKGDLEKNILPEAKEYKNKNMITKTIVEEINEKGKDKAYLLFPFGPNAYKDLNNMYTKIEEKCNEEGKKYIYAYDIEPDKSMHIYGTDNDKVNSIIENINNRVEKLSKNLKDTLIFVIADHGHLNINNVFLEDYPDIMNLLERDISLEPRAVNFFIKEGKHNEFVQKFNEIFSNDFDLYTKQEVIDSKLFGDGDENRIFRDALGDFLAIGKTNIAINYKRAELNEVLVSQHAGYTDDEIYIPLIIINTNEI